MSLRSHPPARHVKLESKRLSNGALIQWRADAMDHIDAAIAADESAAVPRLIKAWMLAGARDARFDAELAVLMREIPDRLSGVADADVGADVGAGDGASDKSAAIEGVYPFLTNGCCRNPAIC